MDEVTAKILSLMTVDTEDNFINALREYYRREYRNGHSDVSFLLWLEGKLDPSLLDGEVDDWPGYTIP